MDQLTVESLFGDIRRKMEALPDGRAKSLVFTKIDEAEMWAERAVK